MRPPALPLSCLAVLVLALAPGRAAAHPIDEVVSQSLIDMQGEDPGHLEVTVFLDRKHLQSYAQVLERMGLPPENSLDDLALTVSHAFSFGPCAVRQNPPGSRYLEKAGGAWVGFRFVIACSGPQSTLTLAREQYSRDKTRTTLLWTVELKGREPIETLVPPHLQTVTVALDGSGVVSSQRGNRALPWKDQVQGASPADPVTGAQMVDELRGASTAPPLDILWAWATEGAIHLAAGLDHLLFLLTLVLCASGLRGLLAGVSGFSLGHMSSMAVSLSLGWPALPWLDVVIGATIALSAWQGRGPQVISGRRLMATSVLFGLIHGLGFGTGLQHLTVGVQQLWWPLLSFGLGLDVAQTLWVGLAAALWAAVVRGRDRMWWQAKVARALMVAGVATGVVAYCAEMF